MAESLVVDSSSKKPRKPRQKKLSGPAAPFISRFRLRDPITSPTPEEKSTALKRGTLANGVSFYHWKYNELSEVRTKQAPKYVQQEHLASSNNEPLMKARRSKRLLSDSMARYLQSQLFAFF